MNAWYEAWHIDLGMVIPNIYVPYALTGFLIPLLYGSWKFTVYHMAFGPVLAKLLTDNPHEFPAIWCLLSLAILDLAILTPLRNRMHVKRWWWGHAKDHGGSQITAFDDEMQKTSRST